MKLDKSSLQLYLVTDRMWLNNCTLSQQVTKSLAGGATMVQLREKHLSHDEFLKEALALKEICKNVPFIINDNLEIAKLVDADGIHIGQDDMSPLIVRKQLGPNKILGVSVQTVKQARLAQAQGADYLGVGAMFNTSTKQDAKGVTYETLQQICEAVTIPVVAIGGITSENITNLYGSGINGVAVVSAILAQDNILTATTQLLHLTHPFL